MATPGPRQEPRTARGTSPHASQRSTQPAPGPGCSPPLPVTNAPPTHPHHPNCNIPATSRSFQRADLRDVPTSGQHQRNQNQHPTMQSRRTVTSRGIRSYPPTASGERPTSRQAQPPLQRYAGRAWRTPAPPAATPGRAMGPTACHHAQHKHPQHPHTQHPIRGTAKAAVGVCRAADSASARPEPAAPADGHAFPRTGVTLGMKANLRSPTPSSITQTPLIAKRAAACAPFGPVELHSTAAV